MAQIQKESIGDRPHIVIAGPVNAGKSTLFNRLIGQEMATVSALPGTTTDPVRKAMELPGVGAVLVIDTPGVDDTTPIGELRMRQTDAALRTADLIVAVGVAPSSEGTVPRWLAPYSATPIVYCAPHGVGPTGSSSSSVLHLPDGPAGVQSLIAAIAAELSQSTVVQPRYITGDLIEEGDTVLLVMPQDSSAPKGRLILPQVQVTRELLDRHCVILSVQPEQVATALNGLRELPRLVITDAQAFGIVEPVIPEYVPLTAFSVLMSAHKGDAALLLQGAQTIEQLTEESRVLIAEACTHAPDSEDIGTVKIPALLRKKVGQGIRIDHVAGKDFADDLSGYDLVIHCGSCMFNRRFLVSRQEQAALNRVPMTNYGMAIAQLQGILPRVAIPYHPRD